MSLFSRLSGPLGHTVTIWALAKAPSATGGVTGEWVNIGTCVAIKTMPGVGQAMQLAGVEGSRNACKMAFSDEDGSSLKDGMVVIEADNTCWRLAGEPDRINAVIPHYTAACFMIDCPAPAKMLT